MAMPIPWKPLRRQVHLWDQQNSVTLQLVWSTHKMEASFVCINFDLEAPQTAGREALLRFFGPQKRNPLDGPIHSEMDSSATETEARVFFFFFPSS